MEVRSLTLRTELLFHGAFGEVLDRGGYLVIRYPHAPGYHWGNCLVFSTPPVPGDEIRWPGLFRREFGANPAIRHMALAWDTGAADPEVVAAFATRHLELERNETLAATDVAPPSRPNGAVAIRQLGSDDDWEAAVRLHALDHGPYDASGYLNFTRQRFGEYRTLTGGVRGGWFGAWRGTQLVGSLGLFRAGSLARYRNVTTHPDFRRQGIAGTLVHAAASVAVRDWNVAALVMEADPDEPAIRLYRSLGFSTVESSECVYWWERPGGPPPPD